MNKIFNKWFLLSIIILGGIFIFSNYTQAAISSVTLDGPNGGGLYGPDGWDITWTTAPVSDPETVNLYYCKGADCGTNTYTLIVANTPNDGTYHWDVTTAGGSATTYKVWVGASSDPLVIGDASDDVFEIDLTAPTTTISGIDISADNGSSATDFITKTAAQTITATLSQALAAEEILWATTDEDGLGDNGDWSDITSSVSGTAVSWTDASFSALSVGTYAIKMKVSDDVNNFGSTTTQSYTLDTTAPTVAIVSSDLADGSYGVGQVVDIDITFSENVTSTGDVTVTLSTGDTCTFTVSGASTGTCNYTVGAGDTSSDLDVTSVSGVVNDTAGNTMTTPSTPTSNLAVNKAIVISTTTISTGGVSGSYARPWNNPFLGCSAGNLFNTQTGKPCVSAVALVGNAYAFGQTLVKQGIRGEACKAWQTFFNEKFGAKLAVDGVCGKLTIATAKAWQKSVGLVADGLLGKMSRAKASAQ